MNEENNSIQPTLEVPVSESEATSVSETPMSESTSNTKIASASESLSDSTSETISETPASTSTADTDLNSATTSNSVEAETPTRTLDDVIPGDGTNKVWISGDLAGQTFDCEGPIELSVKMTKSIWPFVTVEPNSSFERQRFNYSTGVWEPLDEPSIGQQVTDLIKNAKQSDKAIQAGSEQTQLVAKQMQNLQLMMMQQQQTTALIAQKLGAVPATDIKDNDGGNK